MDLANLRVIIVGGATGGCAAALLLARAGAHVTLVERVAQPRAVGAGIALAENGMAVLEHYTQLKSVYVELGEIQNPWPS